MGLFDSLFAAGGGAMSGLLSRLLPMAQQPTDPQSPSAMDYFKGGASDFGSDLMGMLSGNSTGLNFGERQKLFAREPATFDQRFAPATKQPLDDMSLPPGATLNAGTLPSGSGLLDLLMGGQKRDDFDSRFYFQPQTGGVPFQGAGLPSGFPGQPGPPQQMQAPQPPQQQMPPPAPMAGLPPPPQAFAQAAPPPQQQQGMQQAPQPPTQQQGMGGPMQSLQSGLNGIGGNLMAGFQGFANAGSPMQAIGNLVGGLATGERTDRAGMAQQQQSATYKALVGAGVPQSVAMAAAVNPEVLKTIAPQLYSKPEFKTLKNALGEDIPIFANPANQTISYPTANGASGGANAPGGMQQTFDQLEAARQKGAPVDQLLQTIPNSLREGVRAMLSGGSIPSNLSNRGSARDLTLRFAHAIDPTFDESLIPARVALQKSYQGGGKNYQETLALNTVGGHLSRLADAADGLGNSNFKPWNWIKNQVSDATIGSPALVKFRNDLVTTQNELAKAYHGGHVSDSAYNAFSKAIGEAQTPAELKAAIGELGGLLESKITANETGYKAGMNGMPLPAQYSAINGEAKHSFEKINKWVTTGSKTPTDPAAASGLPQGWSVKVH